MRLYRLASVICLGLIHGASGGGEPALLIEDAAQIVIGPTFGRAFDPATEAVTRIRDKKLIRLILDSTVGKKPEEVDHMLVLPHLQVAVLNAKGEIIAAYALDRTPGKNSGSSRAVLRRAQVIQTHGKRTIDFRDMLQGFPCKALEPYRFEDQELPKPRADLARAK